MGSDIVIFGDQVFARIAQHYFECDSRHRVVAFTVHERYLAQREFCGREVIPFERITDSHPADSVSMFVAIGFKRVNKARAEVFEACRAKKYRLVNYVSSRASTWHDFVNNENCFILENVILEPFVALGNDVVVWAGAHVAHDSKIGDHAFIAPDATICGNVTIGARTFIGANATIQNGVSIAPDCIIGAGALLRNGTHPGEVYPGHHCTPSEKTGEMIKSFK